MFIFKNYKHLNIYYGKHYWNCEFHKKSEL